MKQYAELAFVRRSNTVHVQIEISQQESEVFARVLKMALPPCVWVGVNLLTVLSKYRKKTPVRITCAEKEGILLQLK